MRAQPSLDDRLAKRACFEMAIDEVDGHLGLGFEACAVEAEKNVHTGKGDALVAVDEAVVHRQAFPQGRRLLDEIGVVSRSAGAAARIRSGRDRERP